jgi:hypothetical protein
LNKLNNSTKIESDRFTKDFYTMYLFERTFPRAHMQFLQDCTKILTFTFHDTLCESSAFTILLHEETIFIQADSGLYRIPMLNKFDKLMDVFEVLQFDYHIIDITSNILLNYMTCFILDMELLSFKGAMFSTHLKLKDVHMNIYTSKFTLQSMSSGIQFPVTQSAKEQIRCEPQKDHIAVTCALDVLE